MNKILVLLLGLAALILGGCGSNPHHFDVTGFETYYNNFAVAGNVQCDNLIIKFGTLGDPGPVAGSEIVGECITQENATPVVVIDQLYWSQASDSVREELIWHELGHCLLHRVHRMDVLSNNEPASIMNPMLFDPYAIQNNYQYYKTELFGY